MDDRFIRIEVNLPEEGLIGYITEFSSSDGTRYCPWTQELNRLTVRGDIFEYDTSDSCEMSREEAVAAVTAFHNKNKESQP